MRSMEGEVKLNIPAEKAWEMYRDNEIISKINPEMLTSAEYIEEMYDPYIVTFSFLPAQEKGKDEEMCIAKWQVEYETLIPTTPPPEKARDAALAFLMWFDRFASA
ncbi:hypothetical protein D8674_034832 [Pyrus ussuriensis x Pyrus communis]|uniref:Bet v I/Major latex protein domain-containing protein n=1 Tax=Pyrus ussuriensis x Pyrus communis TaxID=2448454 RepID=A0A5N5GAT6_9ROSA|nr:hypothetical protein D8674_034832 [Pyrus ussuriensis x Pyrus communis]